MISLVRSSACSLLAAASFLATPCSANGWELTHNLARRGALELVVADGPLAERCHAAGRDLEARTGLELRQLAPGEKQDTSLPRIVLASWDTPGIEELTDVLGITRRQGGGFRYEGHAYPAPGDALVAWFEDPARPGLPVTLYFSEQLNDLIPLITDFMPPSVPSVYCYQGGSIRFEARLTARGALVYRGDFDTFASWTRYREKAVEHRTGNLVSLAPEEVDEERLEQYHGSLIRARGRLAKWLELGEDQLALRLFVHARFEDLRWFSRGEALAVPNPRLPGAQVLLAPGLPDDGGRAALNALARRALGPPAEAWLADGLSVAAAGSWWGRPLEKQLARIASAKIERPPVELVDPASDEVYSPHLLAPLRALLFRLAVEREGGASAVELWTGARPLVLDAELIEAYDTKLASAAAAFVPAEGTLDLSGYRAGIALEAERTSGLRDGYSGGGYGTRDADTVLERANAAGANAVALSTYAFMENERPRRPDAPPSMRRDATISDVALAATIGKARSLSMRVLLQPHLLTSPSGILAGRQAWSGDASLERLYTEYERFIEHYALLSDLLGVEVLCIGSELVGAMDFVPDPRRRNVNLARLEEKRQRWISIIDRARACFDGGLTYAVRTTFKGYSVGEFELWEHFDFVSVALFEALDRPEWKSSRDVERIGAQVAALERRAQKLERPLLLLPIGFPATVTAAINPRRPGRPGEGIVLERQERLYEALGQVLNGARSRGTLVGAFLWKFSTNPLRSGTADAGYSPLGKPAEDWLPQLFGH